MDDVKDTLILMNISTRNLGRQMPQKRVLNKQIENQTCQKS